MRYLITGGAGFIGSHLAEALLSREAGVSLLDDLSTGSSANVEHLVRSGSVDLTEGSVMDAALVAPLVASCDVVVHLAAAVGVQLIVERPLESLLNNVRGTEVVLEAAAEHGKKVLVASTSEIYGKNAAGLLREDADRILGSPFKSRWAYSTSKAVDEILAYEYWRGRGLPTIVVRLFNCAGPRQTGAYGMVIPRMVRQAISGEPITVFGTGTQSRCFCHVDDTVEALIRLLETDEAVGDVFNIGAQNEISIDGLAEMIRYVTGSRSDIVHIPYDLAYEPGFEDMERRLPDIAKIKAVTGWEPTRSLHDIVRDVMAYEIEQTLTDTVT